MFALKGLPNILKSLTPTALFAAFDVLIEKKINFKQKLLLLSCLIF